MSLDFSLYEPAPAPLLIALKHNREAVGKLRATVEKSNIPNEEGVLSNIRQIEGMNAELALGTEVFSRNITHNLNTMAEEAGIYNCLWRPDENNFEYAREISLPLYDGIGRLRASPEHYRAFNPANGWGDYEGLLAFAEAVLAACREYPAARIEVSR